MADLFKSMESGEPKQPPPAATLDDVVAALLLMKHTLDEIADMLQDVKGKTPDGMGVLDVRVNKD